MNMFEIHFPCVERVPPVSLSAQLIPAVFHLNTGINIISAVYPMLATVAVPKTPASYK